MSKLRVVLGAPGALWLLLVTHLPGPLGRGMRVRYWRRRLRHLGSGVRIDTDVYFQGPEWISIGDRVWIDKGVMLLAGPDRSARGRRVLGSGSSDVERGALHVGDRVHLGPYCVISAIGGVRIGDGCTLSSGVRLYSFSHHFRSDEAPSDRRFHFGSMSDPTWQYMIEGPVVLGSNVGVALDAVLLPGVTIGECSFVTIGSVVNRDFGVNSLIAGNPASRVGPRFREE